MGWGEGSGCKIGFILGSSPQPTEDHDAKGGSPGLQNGTASLVGKTLSKSTPGEFGGSLQKRKPRKERLKGKTQDPLQPSRSVIPQPGRPSGTTIRI